MDSTQNNATRGSDQIELAKQCLSLISHIAAQGATSQDPERIGYALQELSQILLERTGHLERVFELVPADQIAGLQTLFSDLLFFEGQEVPPFEPNQFQIVPLH